MTEIKISKTEKKLRHYITKAIADYKLIEKGDKVMYVYQEVRILLDY